jgi:flagella basal body P-ring formation protein FlgA
MTKATRLSIEFVLLIAVCPLTASARTEIRLREHVAVNTSVVRLADVAEITSDDNQTAEKLAALPLILAPSAGDQRFLKKREIEDMLAADGVQLADIQIHGAAQVAISSGRSDSSKVVRINKHAEILAGRAVQPAVAKFDAPDSESVRHEVRRCIERYLATKSADAAGCEVTCDVAERHLALLQRAESKLLCSGGNAPWTGRQRLVLTVATPQGDARIPVYAEVTPKAVPCVVAVEPIPRGALITAAHVELRSVAHAPKSNERRMPIDAVEKLIGMEARQPIQAGNIVFSDQVQSPVVVKRGELITISSESRGIRVRTTVKALQDRSKGQLVQVESLDTKERFDARVTGLRTAAVMTIASPSIGNQSSTFETARR